MILEYTSIDSRGVVHEGRFIETNEINVGDWILTHHQCSYTGANILTKVIDKKIAIYFNGVPIYNYLVIDGGAYKSNLKHVSIYDQIVRSVDEDEWLKENNKKYSKLI